MTRVCNRIALIALLLVGMTGSALAQAPVPQLPAKPPAAPPPAPPATPPAAQLNSNPGNGKPPLQVSADNGVEWQKDTQLYIARGNAVATRGNLKVRADILTAHYRETTGSKTEIYRVDAVGGVVFNQNDSTVTGSQAVYDVDTKFLRMTGNNLSYANADSRITARDSLEYYDDKKMAIARGNAVATRGEDQVHADLLTGYFGTGDPGANTGGSAKRHLTRIDAVGNVVINSKQNAAYADNATYNPDTKIANLSGNVRINRGADVLLGQRAEVNMNTGTYRLLPGAPGSRVTGVIVPNQPPDATTPTPTPTPAPPGKPPAKKP